LRHGYFSKYNNDIEGIMDDEEKRIQKEEYGIEFPCEG
jgi:hypothetical protein